MSSEGHTFNDSGVESVGDTNPVTDNTEPQPKEIERMDKPKHDVGQTGASNNESEERRINESKHVDGQTSVSINKSEERNIDRLTNQIKHLENEKRELEQCVQGARNELSKEKEKNKEDMQLVIAEKMTAVEKSAAAEEVIHKLKSDIEDSTRTISNLEDCIKQLKQQEGERDKTIKEQKESIKQLKKEAEEKDKTIKVQKESTNKLNKELNESHSKVRILESREKQLRNNEASLEMINKELIQTNDGHVKNMEALKSSFRQQVAQIKDDCRALSKRLEESENDKRTLTLRLSKIAGANLAFQNPNIADLGDPNRPTKLAEKFSELYDNQWTDAFEQIDLEDDQERIKRLFDILKNVNGHCLDVFRNYDADVKESLTNLAVTSKIKELKPERTQEVKNDTGSPSENCFKIPSEKDTTSPLQAESKEEMTGNVGLCHTYLWHKKETEDIGGGCKMIKYKNDIDVKCISPELMMGSECTRHVTAEGIKEEKAEGAAEKGGEEEEGKGCKTEIKMESGSFKQTGQKEAEKKMDGELADENNEYNPDVKSESDSNETAPDVGTDCKKETNSAKKERFHDELVNQNYQSAEMKSELNVKTEGNECTDDISHHDVESIKEKETKQDEHKENEIYLKFDFDTLTNSHKHTISEIRRIVHAQMEDQVVKAISQAVLEEMELPRETGIVSYVEECAKICWLARLHDPPVYIEFEDIKDDSLFKAEMYKAYTKTGKRLDYVVWPPVFLYKNGPMLSKGVAQGK
ncbi:myosin-10-like [Mya arenaria]|uniref:myosin-10-like n=1 Tax=Mya arenaria TaxID=6604 RepID=UPI0022E0946C|nr:myosin-10-like [Mya arenaria]